MIDGISTWGWVFLITAWGLIISLCAFCFIKILSSGKRDKITSPALGRAHWGSRIALIMAMAGNAIGLGNFLRFPVQAAGNGGGVFMIPYFLAFIFLGLPLMWIEWGIGRYGGARGHGSTPGMFAVMWPNRASKYLGVFGVALPFVIAAYYTVIESWTLAFAWFSATGVYFGDTSPEAMGAFLRGFQGAESNQFFSSLVPALVFLAITVALNYFFLVRGLSKGIEVLSRFGMPLLFALAIVLAVRVITVGTPAPTLPEQNIGAGLGFIWNPDFSRLGQASVWLSATGQIFFTVGLGMGIINTYASFLREDSDIALNALTTSSLNEFAEVVLGGTITIPAAVAFFGIAATQVIARGGSFNLGFQAMPVIFQEIAFGRVFGAIWFLLLFIAALTSSVALASPIIAFFQDELKWTRIKAVNITFVFLILAVLPVVLFLKYGFLDELDFWAGTFLLALFAVIEITVFSWIFGIKKGWAEINKSAEIKLPWIYKFVMKYVTPLYLLVILGAWTYQDAVRNFVMAGVSPVDQPYRWLARGLIVVVIITVTILVKVAWSKRKIAAKPDTDQPDT